MSDIKVHCTDKGMDVDGFILNHRHKMFMEVAINTVKVKFQYDPQFKQYIGNMAGLEWIVKEADLPDDSGQFRR